jgi:hypothetical protein
MVRADVEGSRRNVFLLRLRAAAANILGNPRVLWTIAGIMAVRRILADLPVFLPPTADAYPFIDAGRQALSDPGSIYPTAAAVIASGSPFAILWPPPQTLLAIPFALLPPPFDVWVWVATNALMSAVGLFFLYRAIGARSRWSLPAFVLIILWFTPLFEDIRLGQRGGPLMLSAGAAMLAVRRHPVVAGALTGLGTSIKFYPAAMLLSVSPRQRWRFALALVGVGAGVLALSFIPFGNPVIYLTKILIPTLTGNTTSSHDCFQNSTPLLYARLVGGQDFSVGDSNGVWHNVALIPWHLPLVAKGLTYVTVAALFVGMIWASRRSRWAQPFSMSLAFSLGTLVPGEVFTYQFIAMLPLTLVLTLKAIERQRWGTVALVGLALLMLVSSPCALFFPSLWTVAGLSIFGAAVAGSNLFREPADSDGREMFSNTKRFLSR